MQGLDEILSTNGMDAAALGARFGLTADQAKSAMGSLMPAVAGGLHKQAQTGDLSQVEAVASGTGQPDTHAGNQILSQIFGSKDVSRQVAGHAAEQSGVSSTVMKAMLPIVAAMLTQHLMKSQGGTGGGLGGMLGSILGGQSNASGLPGGLGGMLGGGGGGGGGGGNPLDAILGGLAGRR